MAQMTSVRPQSISLEHLLDEHVRDAEGRDIGKVEDLILDAGSGSIDFAIVKFGGFLGMGGKYHLIPWPMLSVDTERRSFTMDVSKDQVERAPSFDRNNVPKTDDSQYLDSVFQYWGMDRAQQHERMSQLQYGEQRASVGGPSQQQGYSQEPESRQQYGQQSAGRDYQQSGTTRGYEDQPFGGGAGQSQGSWDQSTNEVSYGQGQYGPERRRGDVHSSSWTGQERRAGW